jgi:hypothetical protein
MSTTAAADGAWDFGQYLPYQHGGASIRRGVREKRLQLIRSMALMPARAALQLHVAMTAITSWWRWQTLLDLTNRILLANHVPISPLSARSVEDRLKNMLTSTQTHGTSPMQCQLIPLGSPSRDNGERATC